MYKRECCNDHIPQRTCCREVRPSLSSGTQIEHASRPRSDLSHNSHTLQTKTLLLSRTQLLLLSNKLGIVSDQIRAEQLEPCELV